MCQQKIINAFDAAFVFSFAKFLFKPLDKYVPTARNAIRLYIGVHNTHIDSY
jgi:hypothetical protein